MNNNKMNKTLVTSLMTLCLITSAACTEKPKSNEVTKEQETKSFPHHKELPQSVFEGIPFPANQQTAKSAGFTDCKQSSSNYYDSSEVGYKCFLDRKIQFNGYEFASAYVLLNTSNNLEDIGNRGKQTPVSAIHQHNEYTYRSIHLLTQDKLDEACVNKAKSDKSYIFLPSEFCSTGKVFLNKLEQKGWLMSLGSSTGEDEIGSHTMAYYSKDGNYRIVDWGKTNNVVGINNNELHIELEPLSPSSYGKAYKKVFDSNEVTNQAIKKEQDFIKSMKN